jgi:hypothetical protein
LKKKGLRFPPKNQPRYTPLVRDPDAMDVDRLTAQEQADHMKKGLCFVCHLSGHRAMTTDQEGPPRNHTPHRRTLPLIRKQQRLMHT